MNKEERRFNWEKEYEDIVLHLEDQYFVLPYMKKLIERVEKDAYERGKEDGMNNK